MAVYADLQLHNLDIEDLGQNGDYNMNDYPNIA